MGLACVKGKTNLNSRVVARAFTESNPTGGSFHLHGLLQFVSNASKTILQAICILLLIMTSRSTLVGQTANIGAGSYIIDMGVAPQTVSNGLKPYGMIYDLIKNEGVNVIWSIQTGKSKDGIDFSYNNHDYRGGTFIIPTEYRNISVNNRITYWESQGVIGVTTTSAVIVPTVSTLSILRSVPDWNLDKEEGFRTLGYFTNAGIPSTAYGGNDPNTWKLATALTCCDQLFVKPYGACEWSKHGTLKTWNSTCGGSIWIGSHSVSTLENLVNPSDRSDQSNFLTEKDNSFTGTSGPYANSNSLLLWGSHGDGSPVYEHRLADDIISQYIGVTDGGHMNGPEQIFVPRQSSGTTARWLPSTKIIAYDGTQTEVTSLSGDLKNAASVLVYGRGFGEANRGYVMYSGGQKLDQQGHPSNIAAQRSFFNYSFLVNNAKSAPGSIVMSGTDTLYSGLGKSLSVSLTSGSISNYTLNWSSRCGGSFLPDATSANVSFVTPSSASGMDCVIQLTLTDGCGRKTIVSKKVYVKCDFSVNRTILDVTCEGNQNGQITMSGQGNSHIGQISWTWNKNGLSGGSNSGSGTGNAISTLGAGSYAITVTSATGCSTSFTSLVKSSSTIAISASTRDYICYGEHGSINLSVKGGQVPYTYLWNDSSTTRDRSEVLSGNYAVTVTDSQGCIKTSSQILNGQSVAYTATIQKTEITCLGSQDGTIDLTISGGIGGFIYEWSDGPNTEDRIGLQAGNYHVTVTDSDGCKALTSTTINEAPPLLVSITLVDPSCPSVTSGGQSIDGSITLTISGGQSPYTYSWIDGPTTRDRTNLSEGNYGVTITDANGCASIKTISLVAKKSIPSAPTKINK
jgi:hypothetical protein